MRRPEHAQLCSLMLLPGPSDAYVLASVRRPGQAPRVGAPTVALISPINSIDRATSSPVASHGYSSPPWRRDSSRMQPPWQVPLPISDPASTHVFQEAYDTSSSNDQYAEDHLSVP